MPNLGISTSFNRVRPFYRGLLDTFTGSAFAMSTRVLSSAFATQPILQVRRDSDDEEAQVLGDPADANRFITLNSPIVGGGTLGDFVTNGTYGLYNERMWFDGVDDRVSYNASVANGLAGAEQLDLNLDFFMAKMPASGNRFLFFIPTSTNATGLGCIVNSLGQLSFGGRSQSADSFQAVTTTISAGVLYKLEASMNFSTGLISLTLNSGTPVTSTGTFGASSFTPGTVTGTVEVGDASVGANQEIESIISDIYLLEDSNPYFHVVGHGNTAIDWLDVEGGATATLAGSPELYTGQPFNAYVSEARDQSGNGRHAVQTTTTAQPRIVNAGVLETEGLYFDGTNDFLDANAVASDFTGTVPFTLFGVNKVESGATGTKAAFSFGKNDTGNQLTWIGSDGTSARIDIRNNALVLASLAGTASTNKRILTGRTNRTNLNELYENGSLANSSTTNTETSTLNQFSIGSLYRNSRSLYWLGHQSEVICYPSLVNRAAIESEIAAAHGITLA